MQKDGQSILEALLKMELEQIASIRDNEKEHFADMMRLMEQTPELSAYSRQMWTRCEQSLGNAIRKETKNKLGSLEAEAIARFALDSYHRALGASQPKASLKKLFRILKEGWKE